MRPAERQQYSSTAQRGQDSVLRNWAAWGRDAVRRTQIQDRSDRWKHRGCRSGRACESGSEKKLVLIAMLRSNVGNESLLLYQIREGRLPTSTLLLHARSQALAPVIVVVRWPPMHEVWPPRRAFVLADDLPQHRKSLYRRRRQTTYTRVMRNMPKLTETPREHRHRRSG